MLHVGSDGTLRVCILACREEMVLCHTDAISHSCCLVDLVIKVHFLDDCLDE